MLENPWTTALMALILWWLSTGLLMLRVRRAGDVIPEVVGVVPGPRAGYVANFHMPKACPVCGSAVVREKGEANHRCTGGLFCAAQRKQALLHFASRRAMDVEGLGERLAVEGEGDFHCPWSRDCQLPFDVWRCTLPLLSA